MDNLSKEYSARLWRELCRRMMMAFAVATIFCTVIGTIIIVVYMAIKFGW